MIFIQSLRTLDFSGNKFYKFKYNLVAEAGFLILTGTGEPTVSHITKHGAQHQFSMRKTSLLLARQLTS